MHRGFGLSHKNRYCWSWDFSRRLFDRSCHRFEAIQQRLFLFQSRYRFL